jgi:hypothetical protein
VVIDPDRQDLLDRIVAQEDASVGQRQRAHVHAQQDLLQHAGYDHARYPIRVDAALRRICDEQELFVACARVGERQGRHDNGDPPDEQSPIHPAPS